MHEQTQTAGKNPFSIRHIAGAMVASLALTSLGCSSNRPEIEPLGTGEPLPAARNQNNRMSIHQIPSDGFDRRVADFIENNPGLRITSIEGNGNGSYAANSHFAIIAREAHPGESAQSAVRINQKDSVIAARTFFATYPDREIVATAGNGTGTYGRNDYYVIVSQPFHK